MNCSNLGALLCPLCCLRLCGLAEQTPRTFFGSAVGHESEPLKVDLEFCGCSKRPNDRTTLDVLHSRHM